MTSGPSIPPAPTGDDALRALESLVGERTVPRLWHENYWFRRHEAAYLGVAPVIVGDAGRPDSVVVEAGGGEGYGVRLLARAGAGRIVTLDYDQASLAHARRTYPAVIDGRAVRTNLVSLPLAAVSVDVITAFQVIEHLWSPEEFLAETARVLRPGGLLVLTTPNRLTFSPGLDRRQNPANPFHAREFDADELLELVSAHLHVIDLLAVSHGPRLLHWQQQHGDLVQAQHAARPEHWPAEVADLVRSVTVGDFVVAPMSAEIGSASEGSLESEVLDLVVLARNGE